MALNPAIFAKEAAITVLFAYASVQLGKSVILLGKEIKESLAS